MTVLLLTVLGVVLAFGLYLATLSARWATRAADHLDAGGNLPAWCIVFAGAGVVLASLGLRDHFLLVALDGLQYSHVALALILVALSGALVQKRIWLAARIAGVRSPIELFGSYYGSVTVRLFMVLVLLAFALPFAATSLSDLGALIENATSGTIPAPTVVWVMAFFLFLSAAVGGWRGVVYAVAAQSLLIVVLLAFVGLFSAAAFDGLAFFKGGIATPPGTLADKIPGVMQYASGIGKNASVGGVWTTLGIASFGLSLIGIVLSPAFGFLSLTTESRTGFAINQVWMIAGVAGGLLLVVSPVIGAEVAGVDAAALAAGDPSYTALVSRFGVSDPFAAICLVLLLAASLEVAIAFFAAAAANIVTLDIVTRFLLPELTGEGQRLAARIVLAVIFGAMAIIAAFAPLWAAIAGSATLSLSAQLLPAFLGLCWVPWISRSAVISGLIVGMLLVVFTEPVGLVTFEGLFMNLPWGRWPLTIHSAAWGLAFNLVAVLLVSIFTRSGPEREHRQRLHDAFARAFPVNFGRPAARGAKWSLTLIWAFLALGPGAILGNDFFSHPIFSDSEASLGVPSLWAWQVVFWFLGVLIVWWLAYGTRLSIIEAIPRATIDLGPAMSPLERRRVPDWLALLLKRVAERPSSTTSRTRRLDRKDRNR